MKSYIRLASYCIMMLLISSTCSLASDTPEEMILPMGTMTLMAPPDSEREPRLSPVVFSHSLHFQFPCKDCHHTWQVGEPVKSCSTSGCHDRLWAPKPGTVEPGEEPMKSLTGAFHQSCRDCHREELAKLKAAHIRNPYAGPIDCDGCHPEPHSEVVNELEDLPVPLGVLTIDPPEEVYAKRPSVQFPHGLHFGFACTDCHHDWDGESEIEGCSAEGCHDQVEPDSASRDINHPDNTLYYLTAYHKACIGCHKAQLEEQKEVLKNPLRKKETLPAAGPVSCKGCHIEEE